MKNWLYLTLSAVIVAAALFLRLYKIENRAPFDWDQNRDYQAVSDIAKGHATLVGPVAKGDGGFFLGPLYYYLLLPGYQLTNGNPLALPVTSAIFDALAVVAILILLPRLWGRPQSIILAFIWSISRFAIEMSRVSWNVALIPLWVVIMLYFYVRKNPLPPVLTLLLGIVAGLSWHVHATLIPLTPLLLLFLLKKQDWTLKTFFLLAVGYLIPLLPLIFFDLRHAGLEHRLILDFLTAKAIVTPPWGMVIESVFSRLGKNTVAVLTGSSGLQLIWGYLVGVLAVIGLFRGSKLAKISSIIILLNITLVIYLREVGFPEYYLAASYLPVAIVGIDLLFYLKKFGYLMCGLALLLFAYANLHVYTTEITPFSLFRKNEVAGAIAKLGNRVDTRFDLPLGRDAGIIPLLALQHVTDDPKSRIKVLVTESTAEQVFIDGEIATDIHRFGGLRVSYRVVQ